MVIMMQFHALTTFILLDLRICKYLMWKPIQYKPSFRMEYSAPAHQIFQRNLTLRLSYQTHEHWNRLTKFSNLSLITPNLQTLKLGRNNLAVVPSDYLVHLIHLKNIDISRNPYQVLQLPSDLHSLRKLSIHHTENLIELPDLSAIQLYQILTVTLHNSHIQCGLSICWVIQQIYPLIVFDRVIQRCYWANATDSNWNDLTAKQLACIKDDKGECQ